MYGEDEGSILADMGWDADRELEMSRAKWISDMKGKFVIISASRLSPSDRLFYQDRNISRKGFWTKFIANARVFNTEKEAEKVCSRLRYNNQEVVSLIRYNNPKVLSL